MLFGSNYEWIATACEWEWLESNAEPINTARPQPAASLAVWYGSMPESNGKTNWTAILHRKGEPIWDGACITIDRSEYPERVRYEADRMRHLIGELEQEPDILAYDADKHSGYVKPAAHLTIPGALEWDGDNGTHSADGESRGHGEHKTASYQPNYQRMYHMAVMSLIAVGEAAGVRGEDQLNGSLEIIVAIEKLKDRRKKAQALLECSQGDMRQADKIMARQRVELANTEQSRRSFFDLSQDLEKRLAERDALLRSKSGDLIQYAARLLGAPLRELNGLIDEGARMTRPRVEAAVDFADSHMKDVAVQIRHIADALSAIAKPAKQKTCIECESEYCHGVCVERGDEHYDRDQAQKGGCDE